MPLAADLPVNDAVAVGRFLREYHLHGVDPAVIRRLHGSVRGTSVAYRVAPPGREACIIRAFRADGAVPPQSSGTGAETMADWVIGRAQLLASLEQAGYRAPRPVRDRAGDLVGTNGPWLTWATTFADGPLLRPTPAQLTMLGAALGHLHTIRAAEPVPARAAWHPALAVPATLDRLESVAALVPPDWQPMHAAFLAATRAVQRAAGQVPEALVHGDAWPGSAVESAPGKVTLIDWETAGLGLPVLDLGHCLAECLLDSGLPPDRPEAWLAPPDEERIAAVAVGYTGHRILPAAERELLADAVRFGAAFVGAIHLQAALTGGAGGPSMDARLARLRHRLAISGTVAELALRYLAP